MIPRLVIIVQNMLVVAYLAGLVVLVLRTAVTQDMRFGWGMFGTRTDYEVTYHWRTQSGRWLPVTHPLGLRGKAAKLLVGGRTHATHYGLGAVRVWVRNYVDYVFSHLNDAGFATFEALLRYRVNNEPIQHMETFIAGSPQ